ncbi:MAG: hypothetical protein MZV64_19970 [Ignavibacteriales bacterium]|nr:hypothetical protein [Ignavibacteriales bacterium]
MPLVHGHGRPHGGGAGIDIGDRQPRAVQRQRHLLGGGVSRRRDRRRRRVVDRGDRHVDDVGGAGEGGRAADAAGVDLGAGRAAGPVPGPQGQGRGRGAVVVGRRGKVQPGAGVVGQEQRLGRADRAHRRPVRTAVDAVVPGAVGLVAGGDRDALDHAAVHVADAADEGAQQRTYRAGRHAGVLGHGQRQGRVGQHRRVVHRIDRNRHRRNVGIDRSVVGLVRKAVAAVPVRHRRVAETAVGVQGECGRVRRAADQDRRDRVTVGIGVVQQHAIRGDDQGRVFVGTVGVVVRDRSVIRRRCESAIALHKHAGGVAGALARPDDDLVAVCVRDDGRQGARSRHRCIDDPLSPHKGVGCVQRGLDDRAAGEVADKGVAVVVHGQRRRSTNVRGNGHRGANRCPVRKLETLEANVRDAVHEEVVGRPGDPEFAVRRNGHRRVEVVEAHSGGHGRLVSRAPVRLKAGDLDRGLLLPHHDVGAVGGDVHIDRTVDGPGRSQRRGVPRGRPRNRPAPCEARRFPTRPPRSRPSGRRRRPASIARPPPRN